MQSAAQIPWRNNQALLDKVKDPSLRVWYARQNACNGWSWNILNIQMNNGNRTFRKADIKNRNFSRRHMGIYGNTIKPLWPLYGDLES
ncbi:MAG: hypothetical protein HQK65_08730 [Desulfamplus sp.]|nr:hypothetical protein [Desulfamplus sp.]